MSYPASNHAVIMYFATTIINYVINLFKIRCFSRRAVLLKFCFYAMLNAGFHLPLWEVFVMQRRKWLFGLMVAGLFLVSGSLVSAQDATPEAIASAPLELTQHYV